MSEPARERFDNERTDPITKFREAYADIMREVRVSIEHTSTEGWLALYANHREADKKARRALSERMAALAETIADYGSNEETEKAIGECKKQATELREMIIRFRESTIEPVRHAVDEAAKMRQDAINQARRYEQDTPLVNAGLEILMREAIAAVDAPVFDEEKGLVLISKRAA